MPSPNSKRLAKALGDKLQKKQRIARATVTSISYDSLGRVSGAVCTIDGLAGQSVQVDHGMTLAVGDVLGVQNDGGQASPSWRSVRRLHTIVPVPALPYSVTLPVPTGLTLTTGLTYTDLDAYAHIYARFYLLDSQWGVVSYDIQYVTGTDDPVSVSTTDPSVVSQLVRSVGASDLTLPRTPGWDLDYPAAGVVRIGTEDIAYTAATRKEGIWLYPYYGSDIYVGIADYVEDQFADTDTTNITAHTPDYDRYAGGWYVIPTYSSNWAISGNKVVAAPGGTWPYSAALIAARSGGWYAHRVRGDWTFPSSGTFGYIMDYADASNLVYVRYDVDTETLEVVERISAGEATIWSEALTSGTLSATETYTFEVQVVSRSVYIRISGGDLDEAIEYEADSILTNLAESSVVGIWSDVAVTLDNFWLDDPRERDFEVGEWTNYVYYVPGFGWDRIHSHTNSTGRMHVFEVYNTGASGPGQIYPAFVGLTRGYNGTVAASHSSGDSIYSLMQGVFLAPLSMSEDYSVRVRARIGDSIISPWSDWSTIQTLGDEIAPAAPADFAIEWMVGSLGLTWSGPTAADEPDLAGFAIYVATDYQGTGATLLTRVGVAESAVVQVPAGTAWYNIKAFDWSGNYSGYGETEWARGESFLSLGEQWLTNSDFDRDQDADDEPDEWDIVSNSGVVDLGAYGWGGGTGLRFTLDDQDGFWLRWPRTETDESIQYTPIKQLSYTVSIKMKCSDPNWIWRQTDAILPGYTRVTFKPYYYGGTTNPVGSEDSSLWTPDATDLGGGWQLLQVRAIVYIDTDDFIGFSFQVTNDSGSSITVDLDQAKLENGAVATAWTPNIVRATSTSGLLFDTSGLAGDSILINAAGQIASDLEPAQDNAFWLGKAQNWQGVTLKDTLSATPSGVSGDSKIFVDTDGKAKVRHGTATPISLEEQGGVFTLDSNQSYASGPVTLNYSGSGYNTITSFWLTVPTGWKVFVTGHVTLYMDATRTSNCRIRLTDGTSQTITEQFCDQTMSSVTLTALFSNTGSKNFLMQGYRSSSYAVYAQWAYLYAITFPDG